MFTLYKSGFFFDKFRFQFDYAENGTRGNELLTLKSNLFSFYCKKANDCNIVFICV